MLQQLDKGARLRPFVSDKATSSWLIMKHYPALRLREPTRYWSKLLQQKEHYRLEEKLNRPEVRGRWPWLYHICRDNLRLRRRSQPKAVVILLRIAGVQSFRLQSGLLYWSTNPYKLRLLIVKLALSTLLIGYFDKRHSRICAQPFHLA